MEIFPVVPNRIIVEDTTDVSSFVALFESATGALAPKTDGGITYNAGTGELTVTKFTDGTASITGGDITTSGKIISTGGGQTGKFLTGGAGATVFAFSGTNFDIRAGDGMQSAQNVLRVTSTGDFDFKAGNLITAGEINFRDTDISIGSTLTDGILDLSADFAIDMFFDNADRGAEEDGQHLNINRRAAEGDDYIRLYVDKDKKGLIGFSGDDDLIQLAANALTVNGTVTATGTITGELIDDTLTATRVLFAGASGNLSDNSAFVFVTASQNQLTLNTGQLSITGTNLTVASAPDVLVVVGGEPDASVGGVHGSNIRFTTGPGGATAFGTTSNAGDLVIITGPGGNDLTATGGVGGDVTITTGAGGTGGTQGATGNVKIDVSAGDGTGEILLGDGGSSNYTKIDNVGNIKCFGGAEIYMRNSKSIFFGTTITDMQIRSDGTNGVIDVATALRVGNEDTNYTQFVADGLQTMVGTARVMISIDLEPVLATRPSANPPAEGTEDSFATHDFAGAATDQSVFFHLELPHDYADAGTIHVHFDFFVDVAEAGATSVVWGVEYKKQSIGDNFSFTLGAETIGYTQTSVTSGAPANNKKTHQSSEISLTTSGFVAGDYILLRLFRDADESSGLTDDFPRAARVIDYHIEYLSDKLGEAT